MTDVSLKAFRFALPTMIEFDSEESGKAKATTEFPQEFFGLPAPEQVSVIGALLRACELHLENMGKADHSKCSEPEYSSLHIGISVVLKKSPRLVIDAEFNFPNQWNDMAHDARRKVLLAFSYLMQNAGISIVEREDKYGALNV